MAQTSCIECGYPFNGTETSCPECGSPIQSQNPTPITPIIIDEGDHEAENILRNTLNWIKILLIVASIILWVVWAALGVIAADDSGNPLMALLGILGGGVLAFLGFVFAKLIWAVGMIFINISTNVRTIKREIISK